MDDIISFNTETQAFGMQQPPKCSGYGLGAMIRDMVNPIGLEIGCDIGDTSNFLLDSNPTLDLTSIDPYENYVDWNGNHLHQREEMYHGVMQRLDGYSNRFELIRRTSDDAVELFVDETFDFIFIDGLHTYEQLTKDCANYYSKLKSGGIFAGHDFTAIEGVNRAAKEFSAQVGREIHFTEKDVWYWIK
jgi:predicted O-methyltransferase YrrM